MSFLDLVFLAAFLIGGTLVVLSIVLGELVDGILDSFDIDVDVGGVSVFPLMMAFLALFGAAGLTGRLVLGFDPGFAAGVAAGMGLVGAAVMLLAFAVLNRMQAPQAFSMADLVGTTGRVTVGIQANRYGTVLVTYAGMTHNPGATAGVDIPAGTIVRIVGHMGSTVIVEPLSESSPTSDKGTS